MHLFDLLPREEPVITDVLMQIVIENIPAYCREKNSYNVPIFYWDKANCIIWPATVPRGGIDEAVLFDLWHSNKLADTDRYLTHCTNKQIFYKIYKNAEGIKVKLIVKFTRSCTIRSEL